MPCNKGDCKCNVNERGEYLNRFLDFNKSTSTNFTPGYQDIFKSKTDMSSSFHISTISPEYVSIFRIAFNCKLKLSSVVIRSTFREIRIYAIEVGPTNYNTKAPYETVHGNGSLCFNEYFLKDRRYRDLRSICMVFIGNEPIDDLYFVGFKGKYLSALSKPVIATYEAMSTESIVNTENVKVIK